MSLEGFGKFHGVAVRCSGNCDISMPALGRMRSWTSTVTLRYLSIIYFSLIYQGSSQGDRFVAIRLSILTVE